MKNRSCQISTGDTEKNCKSAILCDLWVYTFVFSVQYAIYIVRVVVPFLSQQIQSWRCVSQNWFLREKNNNFLTCIKKTFGVAMSLEYAISITQKLVIASIDSRFSYPTAPHI